MWSRRRRSSQQLCHPLLLLLRPLLSQKHSLSLITVRVGKEGREKGKGWEESKIVAPLIMAITMTRRSPLGLQQKIFLLSFCRRPKYCHPTQKGKALDDTIPSLDGGKGGGGFPFCPKWNKKTFVSFSGRKKRKRAEEEEEGPERESPPPPPPTRSSLVRQRRKCGIRRKNRDCLQGDMRHKKTVPKKHTFISHILLTDKPTS